MPHDAQSVFRDVAGMSSAERVRYFAAQSIPGAVRAEVESLLRFDSETDCALTDCVGGSAAGLFEAESGAPERRFGPYRVIRKLGRGGMGTVFLAERADGEVEQRVAIKVLRFGGDDPTFRKRFLQERQILATLNHPGIARLFDAGRDAGGEPYLVMEYVEGTPIDVYAKSLDLRAKLSLFLPVCDAVAYAHRSLIVHRDLKPSNILVDRAGRPKLLDFGIAKMLDAGPDQTQTADRLLTPGYASPEQLQGRPPSTAADVYSLAAVLQKLVMVAPDGLPKDLRLVLEKALRPEPEERYVSVDAFAADLRAFVECRPVHARSESAWYRARKFVRRRWLPVAALGLALAGLSVGLVLTNRARATAQRRFQEVRQLANKLFDIDAEAATLPGSTKTRQIIIDTAIEYLRRLAADARNDPALAIELAGAYTRVAQVQGLGVGRNLGQMDQASESLRIANGLIESAIRAQPGNRAALVLASQIAAGRMLLASNKIGRRDLGQRGDALTFARQAAGWLDRFNVKNTDGEQADAALGVYMSVADQFYQARQFDEALRICRRAREIARQVNRAAYEGLFLWVSSEVLQDRGDLDEALTAIREADKLADPGVGNTNTALNMAFAHVLIWEGRILGQENGVSLDRFEESAAALLHAFSNYRCRSAPGTRR